MWTRKIAMIIAAAVLTCGLVAFAQHQNPKKDPPAPGKPQTDAKQHDEGDEDNETAIKLADAPDVVRAAILKLTPEKNIKAVTKEMEHGMTLFEVEWEADGASKSADLSDKGDVLAIDTIVKPDALPPAASAAISKHFPKSTVKSAESVQQFYYEVLVMVDGKPNEVKVAANGQIMEDEHKNHEHGKAGNGKDKDDDDEGKPEDDDDEKD